MNRIPLVIILGATGSGKTKLSLELAKSFGGEIVGADSMQVYKGLDIITAKASVEEQSQAPHHLIDILEPHETFTVVEYRNRALKIINNLMEQKKMPIVVGGTNYYIESLLWKILVDSESDKFKKGPILPDEDYQLSNEELYNKLLSLDPDTAKRLHPNNVRKIIRSLEVLHKNGRKLSEIIKEQKISEGGNVYGGALRYPNSLVLWLQCDQEILDERLNNRVDLMMEQGLLKELLGFHKCYNEKRLLESIEPNYTKGIFQSIGFKEFHPYLMLSEEERNSQIGQKKLNEGVEQLKLVTRRYARKQKRWITNRFLGRTDRHVPPLFGLDTSDTSRWTENVTKVAEEIVQSYITATSCPIEPLPRQQIDSTPNNEDTTHVCEACNRVFVGSFQWNIHLKSRKHKRLCNKKREPVCN